MMTQENPYKDRPFGQARPDYVDVDTKGALMLLCGECHTLVYDGGTCGCAKSRVRVAYDHLPLPEAV